MTPEPERTVYLPANLMVSGEFENLSRFPEGEAPAVILDRLEHVGGAYLDLLSVSQRVRFQGTLPAPAEALGQATGRLSLYGRARFDWPVVLHKKEHSPERVREALAKAKFRLLGEPGEDLQFFLPTSNELVLVRLVEQWRVWGSAGDVLSGLSENSLNSLSIRPLSEAVVEADVSLLMRSQWDALKSQDSANVVAYEELQELPLPRPSLVAPWGLLSAHTDSELEDLVGAFPEPTPLPQGAQLSEVTRGRARLLAHTLFPSRFGRQSEVASWDK